MDWLIWSIIIALSVAVLIMIRKNYQIKKEAELFAGKVEDTLEAIITGRGWKAEEELEDSLWGANRNAVGESRICILAKRRR